jgi:CRP/FNR family transcriptional regulator, cyclic AMP receptor protein
MPMATGVSTRAPHATATERPPGGGFPLLRRTELRRFLNEPQLKELERYCRTATRKAGTTMFRQDERAENLYLLVEGTIELRARPPGRHAYRTVEMIGPGCTFGDEAVLDGPSYLSSARALDHVKLLLLPRSAFDRLADARPDIAVGVLRCSGGCLLQTIRRAAILTQAPADVALRLFLDELAGSSGPVDGRPVPLRITHAQLAGVLHLSRETVSRMLGQMAAEGSIELGRGVIRHRRTKA